MASLTAAETTIRRTLPCSHLLNRKDIRDSHGLSAVGKALGEYATSCQLAPGEDSQRIPEKKIPLVVFVFRKDRTKRPMSLRSHGGGEEGLWHAIRPLSTSQVSCASVENCCTRVLFSCLE